jgi:hypothetical protein
MSKAMGREEIGDGMISWDFCGIVGARLACTLWEVFLC